eukprot:scaffold11839_cov57-Phaeocystis_antarctica.AAC.2
MGVVTAVRWGSRSSRLVSTGETRMRKRCLSRWLDSDVMRSLKSAMPCIATTCVLPTSRGSHLVKVRVGVGVTAGVCCCRCHP